MGDSMKKLLYIFLFIFITINLAACNENTVSKVTEKANESSNSNTVKPRDSLEKDKIIEANTDMTKDENNSVKETAMKADSKDFTTAQSSNSSKNAAKPAAQSNKVSANSTNTTVKNSTGSANTSSSTQQQVSQHKNKIIVIDPGHANRSNLEKEPLAPGSTVMKIKDGGGAQGVATGTPEYRINMNVSVKLKAILQNNGYTVVMTKTLDSQSLGNVERANIWNNANAALVLRIHADSSTSSSAKGASMLVPSPINNDTKAIYAASKSYGKTVLNTLVQEVGMPNRGVIEHNDMTGFNWTKVPVILVEMGFLSNPEEDRMLSSDAYENKIAKALADGIMTALK